MSEAHSELKHRHDIGHPEHGPTAYEGITVGIQGVLGLCIAGTILVVLFALFSL